jgi:hypothetical protein
MGGCPFSISQNQSAFKTAIMMPEEKLLENVPLWYRKVNEKRKFEDVSGNLTTLSLLLRAFFVESFL